METKAPFVLDVGIPTAKSLPADGDVIIEGYAADFTKDREGEMFLPGAFTDACAKAAADEIPLLHEHDNNKQLGVVEQLKVDDTGLWMRARVAKAAAGSWAEDIVNKIQRGMQKGLSVRGFSRIDPTPDGNKIGWIDLHEISVTPVPMQPGALFAVASKSMAYADDPATSEIAWAAEGWAEVKTKYTDDEIREAVRAYLQRRIDEATQTWAKIRTLFDDAIRLKG